MTDTYNVNAFEIYRTSTPRVFFFATREPGWKLPDLIDDLNVMEGLDGTRKTAKLVWMKLADFDSTNSRADNDALAVLRATYGDKNVMAIEIKHVTRKEQNPRDIPIDPAKIEEMEQLLRDFHSLLLPLKGTRGHVQLLVDKKIWKRLTALLTELDRY